MKSNSFFKWLADHHDGEGGVLSSDDLLCGNLMTIGYLLFWLYGGRSVRAPDVDPGPYDQWTRIIKKKASKTQVDALLACFDSAWSTWRGSQLSAVGGDRVVRESTVAVLRRVTKTLGDGHIADSVDRTINVRSFIGDVARVSYGVRVTKDLGGFESVQVGMNIEVPCYSEETADAAFFARDFCHSRVQNEVEYFCGANRLMPTRGESGEMDVVEMQSVSEPSSDDLRGIDISGYEDEENGVLDEDDNDVEPVEWGSVGGDVDMSKLGF